MIVKNDNTEEFLRRMAAAKKRALTAIGIEAEGFAKKDPNMPVDTGRARNSITWATKEKEGQAFAYSDDEGKVFTDQIGAGADVDSVYIGSNVEYFPTIELGGRNMNARHVLKNAAEGHKERYKELLEESIRNA